MSDIFVFGSNLAGRHGKGAARTALRKHGAIYGQGEGLQGESYAIPTKDEHLDILPLSRVREGVTRFIDFAKQHPEMVFQVTKIGCGLAGWAESAIWPMFKDAPMNCKLPSGWRR